MIKAIRDYLISDKKLKLIIGNNIFLQEKPLEIKADTYICLLFKPLDGGVIKTYQLEIRCFGNNILKLIELENALIECLDWVRQKNIISENCIIYNSELLNGGGTITDENGVIERLLFFMLKIKNK